MNMCLPCYIYQQPRNNQSTDSCQRLTVNLSPHQQSVKEWTIRSPDGGLVGFDSIAKRELYMGADGNAIVEERFVETVYEDEADDETCEIKLRIEDNDRFLLDEVIQHVPKFWD